MDEFPSIERVNEILNGLADSIPQEYYQGLSGGVILLDTYKIHPEAKNHDLYIMGEYRRTPREKQIRIYYGSFKEVYKYASEQSLVKKLDEVLKHELTHHLEYKAGYKDLEIEDMKTINEYKRSIRG